MVSVSAAICAEAGLAAGDPIDVTLAVAQTPREILIPDDCAVPRRGRTTVRSTPLGLFDQLLS